MRFFKKHYRLACGVFLLALFIFWTGFLNSSPVKTIAKTDDNVTGAAEVKDIPSTDIKASETAADQADTELKQSETDITETTDTSSSDDITRSAEVNQSDNVSADTVTGDTAAAEPDASVSDVPDTEDAPEVSDSEEEDENVVVPMGPLENYDPEDDSNTVNDTDTSPEVEVTETAGNDTPDEPSEDITVPETDTGSETPADTDTTAAEDVTASAYTPVETPIEERPVFNYCVADVASSMNIRSGPSTGYPVIGKMHSNAWATVLERGEEWSRISSGGIEGYAYNSYLLFGDNALNRIKKLNALCIKVYTNVLNVRTEPNTNCRIIKRLTDGDKYPYVPEYSSQQWFAIRLEDDQLAFVSTQFCSVYIDLPTITRE